MTVQPSHVTVLETIEHLDFAFEPPCEHSAHEASPVHSGPAFYVIATRCPQVCGYASKTLLVCKSGYEKSPDLKCAVCNYVGPSSMFWRLIGTVGGQS